MAANPNPLRGDGTDRLVVPVLQSKVTAATFGFGALALIGAGALLLMGNTPVPSLVCLAGAALAIYALRSEYLWADAQEVGVNRLLFAASCRRDDLDRLQIVYGSKGNYRCEFVRMNGRIAFRVSYAFFGKNQLAAFAQSLGVPYYGLDGILGARDNLPPGV